jgi:hypothetical protein
MNPPQPAPKTYYIKRAETEIGPLTLAQINRMRSLGQLSADTLCRDCESAEYQPLVAHFPHLADRPRKTREEHRKEARALEGNGLANAALACGVLSWAIATPILSVFAMVLGGKSYLLAHRMAGLYGALLGVLAFMFWLARFMKFIPEP